MVLLLWWILLVSFCSAHSDFFTSVGTMMDLVLIENQLVTSLKEYIRAEEEKLQVITRWAERLEAVSAAANQDAEGFLGHPVNAFKLMKRMNTEWAELESLVLRDVSDAFLSNLSLHRRWFPDEDDQVGAAKALFRLQDTYRLDTDVMACGELPGSAPWQRSALTAEECFSLGKVAYSEGDYYHTELWMQQALKMLRRGDDTERLDAVTVLDYLSYSVYQQGALQRALRYTRSLLKLDPTHQRAIGNLKYFEYQLAKQKKEETLEETQEEEEETQEEEEETQEEEEEEEVRGEHHGRHDDYLPERRKYEALCRGEGLTMTPRRQSRLFCRYHDNGGHPRYVIGPVRQEDEWDEPLIVRYHDIVSDAELEKVKELAKPRLRRATVHDPQTGKLTTAHYRVSKSAWLGSLEHPIVDQINRRIQDVTGLDVSTAEDLQVANYGVGGQYEPHFDFGREDEPDAFEELGTGNRIATWLLYMSDVQAGGATVFTDVGAAVWPKKGSAVFWYNLFPSGDGDYRTRHAACPVLVGNKWVSNKWIHERGQEFRRRCDLQGAI